MGQLFLNENATVTYCHSKTQNMKELSKLADILIVAVGRPKMITADYIKEGAVVIDVGVNRLETGKLCGDVDFDNVLDV
ncbi:bifunctional methylenetetrahydrofolate dehydrogenase/methenyltetrahydrofolate cyclohydrolase, partial [Acinetobacter baumannii]|nr:bifunctional methylenetetrahydrofolate dehydrogenase/methenyltetrahydrofolate cyclohydrolase [Acinetobacter baumannii]